MNKEIQEKQDRLVLNSMWDAIERIEGKLEDLIYTVEGIESRDQGEYENGYETAIHHILRHGVEKIHEMHYRNKETPELIEGVHEALDDLCNIKK